MKIEDIIKNKIKDKSREDIVYIHPVISNEKIAEYISVFSNDNGGIILFGVKDDGINLWLKNSVFKIIDKETDIKKMIDFNAKIKFGKVAENGYILEYIYVEKNDKLICYDGKAYSMNNKIHKPEEIKNRRIFLSYCQKDSDIADILEEKLQKKIKGVKISRDIRDVEYKESFSDFMQSIGSHDYVITIISDRYLKSRNCMYEVLEIMRDRAFINKLLYIVIFEEDLFYYKNKDAKAANIYTVIGQTEYIKYWKNEDNNLRKEIKELGDPLLINNLTEELKILTKIQIDIQEFMKILNDRKAVSFKEMFKSGFEDIINSIQG